MPHNRVVADAFYIHFWDYIYVRAQEDPEEAARQAAAAAKKQRQLRERNLRERAATKRRARLKKLIPFELPSAKEEEEAVTSVAERLGGAIVVAHKHAGLNCVNVFVRAFDDDADNGTPLDINSVLQAVANTKSYNGQQVNNARNSSGAIAAHGAPGDDESAAPITNDGGFKPQGEDGGDGDDGRGDGGGSVFVPALTLPGAATRGVSADTAAPIVRRDVSDKTDADTTGERLSAVVLASDVDGSLDIADSNIGEAGSGDASCEGSTTTSTTEQANSNTTAAANSSAAPSVITFLPFEKAREYAQGLQLEEPNLQGWLNHCATGHLPRNIPLEPNLIYARHGWVSMQDWLGGNTEDRAPVVEHVTTAGEIAEAQRVANQVGWLVGQHVRRTSVSCDAVQASAISEK